MNQESEMEYIRNYEGFDRLINEKGLFKLTEHLDEAIGDARKAFDESESEQSQAIIDRMATLMHISKALKEACFTGHDVTAED